MDFINEILKNGEKGDGGFKKKALRISVRQTN
jgi:hypothetical protein